MFKFPTKLLKSWEMAVIGNLTVDIGLFQKYDNTLCCSSKILHIIKAMFSMFSITWFYNYNVCSDLLNLHLYT